MRIFYATIAPLLLSMVFTIPVPASMLPAETLTSLQPAAVTTILQSEGAKELDAALSVVQPATRAATNVFLPIVVHRRRIYPPCSSASPFSVEIAALHQVVPARAQASTGQGLAEAQWWAFYEEAFPTLMEALETSGACWARVLVDWSWIQPDPPPTPYRWGSYHDDKLRLVAETGVQLIVHVGHIPAWAGPSSCGPIDPGRLDEFAQFLTDLVNRYKGPPWNIHYWELFNEPDGTWPEKAAGGIGCWGFLGDRYAQMLAVAYPAIKSADPDATVLMGGVAYDWFTDAPSPGPFNRYFTDDVMAAGGAEHLDVANFHYFPDFRTEWERWNTTNLPTCGIVDDGQDAVYEAGGPDLIAKASHFRNRLQTCFGVEKPLWVTELAEHGRAGDPSSLAQQARYVIQGYARGLAAGVQNITWFALVTPPYDSAQQGLLYDDFAPKPAFYAYRALAHELSGYAYASTLDAPDVEGYVFRKAYAPEKTVAWGSGRVSFSPATEVRVVDRGGKMTYVQDGGLGDEDGTLNGAIELQMTADPIFMTKQ